MSRADREKWDQRYRAGAFAERTHPSALLEDWIDRLPGGRALDLACGAGRNSLFLARRGFEVTGIDVSTAGLQRARRSALDQGLEIVWRQQDLDDGLHCGETFNVVCLFRYFNRQLIRSLPSRLAPGGILLAEEHLAVDADCLQMPLAGPSNPAFLVKPGELRNLTANLEPLHQEEGIVTDPDGRQVALSRLVATNRPAGASPSVRRR
ncbi:MAG: class I SAM-dependent methyltransferase [Gammaproteobacteria bacterium]|nr:class I SAM-dependent methyltransferase [Gammaproteobacteria bacterium]